MTLRAAILLGAAASSAIVDDAAAQSVVLTEKGGRPLVVGATELSGGSSVTTLAPAAIAAEFARICLPQPATASDRIAGSSLGLASAPVRFPAEGKTPEAVVPGWAGSGAAVFVWTGGDEGLKGRPIAITSRAYTTTGPYGPFKAAGGQCNLVVNTPDFAFAQALAGALEAQLGKAPDKLVSKNTFADGFWTLPDNIRINFTAPTTRTGAQPIHLSVQVISKEAR